MSTIYEHRDTITASGGASSSTSLNVRGGVCRQVLVRANTDTTKFFVDLTDSSSITRRSYGMHTGELNDMMLAFPMAGSYTLNITNASADDTFTVLLAVEE